MNIAEAKRYVARCSAERLRADVSARALWTVCPFSEADRKRIADAAISLADELERRAFRKADG